MDEPKLSAYRVTQEFLNDTSNLSGKDEKQLLVDALRRARGVVYQCAMVLAPPPEQSEQPTTKPITFESGLETQRLPIFESLTTKPNWASGMLFAVNTAKKMGCTNFEITVKDAEDREKGRQDPRFRQMYGMFGYPGDEDWQSGPSSCHKVTIFAVTIK